MSDLDAPRAAVLMKHAPLDYLNLARTEIPATGAMVVFGLSGTGKTSRAVLPILTQFAERMACAAPPLYLSAHPDDMSYDLQEVVVRAPRAERGGGKEDTEWQNFALGAIDHFARSTEVYRALAIDADILPFLGLEGIEAVTAAVNSAAESISKFILVTASSVNVLPLPIRMALEKGANTRIFFTIADIDTIGLVRTTVFPRPFWLPRRVSPRNLRSNGRYADAIIETEVGKKKESRLIRLPNTAKRPVSEEAAAHVEHFSR